MPDTKQNETPRLIAEKQEPWNFNVDPYCAGCDHLLREHRGPMMSDPCGVAGCRCEYACYQPKRTEIRGKD